MGRKWTNITFQVKLPDEKIAEASSQPRTREKALYDYTEHKWHKDNIPPHDKITVTFGGVGRNQNKLEKYLEKYFLVLNGLKKQRLYLLQKVQMLDMVWYIKTKKVMQI